jgi:ParB-like nuclease domain
MADENREEFRSDARVTIETLSAVIEAYGRGEIELEPVDPKTNTAYIYYAAPSGAAYTLSTVAAFLGWVKKRWSSNHSSLCRMGCILRYGKPSMELLRGGELCGELREPPRGGNQVKNPGGTCVMNCENCGRWFEANREWQRFCRPSCRESATAKRLAEERKAKANRERRSGRASGSEIRGYHGKGLAEISRPGPLQRGFWAKNKGAWRGSPLTKQKKEAAIMADQANKDNLKSYQVLPSLDEEEFAALKADIAARGVLVAIEVDEDGNVIDGHHRLRAWEELTAAGTVLPECPKVVRSGMTEPQKREHARILNAVRRQLTRDQKRDLIKQQLQETPEKSDRQIASMFGISHPTVAVVRYELETNSQVERFTTRVGRDKKSYPVPSPSPEFKAKLDLWEANIDAGRAAGKAWYEETKRRIESPDVTLEKLHQIITQAQDLQNRWGEFRLRMEREVGKLLLAADSPA